MKSRSIGLIVILIIGVLVLFLGCGGCNTYNTMVNQEENVKTKWANVESDYQRRADLIPNLVATVKGAADFEQETLTRVTEARAKASSMNVDAGDLSAEQLQRFQQAQSELSGALSRLLVTVERYPELKANANFLDLQKQLEGTENRIKVSRNDFNTAVQSYNSTVRKFPNNIYAGLFGFETKPAFTADPGAERAPQVSF